MQLPKRKLLEKEMFFGKRRPILVEVDHDTGLCPTYLAAMAVLAKPWNGLIIAVLEEGPFRYSEMASRLPTIGDRMLALRLKELTERGLVARLVEPGPPVRVVYELTDVGRGFKNVAHAVRLWGQAILAAQEKTQAPRRATRRSSSR